ncbi:tetratricopeptide repeat protein [Azospirillum sp. Sh1]|uniref:tetratricopeptide repeat protein n=1 Tax=Azospirillum sp. Sh1 TaxID=2607285 RepID=UPI0011EDEB1B|nr:tetratricopeptide repeat protein [Azospirillum sp. Sh1]KAA0571676.1 tetratricopeptide repeat protein [Azospirillum sp. Sh1]
MIDTLSTSVETIWAWLNAGQNAGAVSALLAVMALAGSAGGWLWQRKSKAPTPDQTGGTYVSASTGGVGTGGPMTGNTITTNHGLTPEHITALFAGVRDLSPATEEKAATELYGCFSRAALSSFFTILREQEVPAEQLPAKLTEIALRHREALDRLAALQRESPDDPQRLANARVAIEKGQYEHADSLLAAIEEEQAAARTKAQANADDLARRQSATRAERARLSELRFDHRGAADHFLAAANLLPPGDMEDRGHYLASSADAFRQYGVERGDNNVLRASITRYHEALLPRDGYPTLWARVQNNLGTALQTLGEREGDIALHLEAVNSFNNALLEYTRDRRPLDWAMTQNNLGNALRTLGERERGSTRLLQAVDAFNNALLEYTRSRAPLDWAMTQNNLGGALQALGDRYRDSARLLEAVEAYNNALLEWTRDRAPLDWAMTQNNLGAALSILGKIEKNNIRLQQAVDAYNNALLEWTRDRAPFNWAGTQTNMGNTLSMLAKLTCNTDSAKQAVAAQEAALAMFTHLNTPYYITVATDNLAAARATLAKLESSAAPAPHQ